MLLQKPTKQTKKQVMGWVMEAELLNKHQIPTT